MKFKLRHMEVFRAVMLGGSITNAAKMLFVTQPAVSRMLAYIEKSLGLQLFHRDHGRLQPTPDAMRLFQEVEVVYAAAARADRFAANLAAGPSGALEVCVSFCLSRLAARAAEAFMTEVPDTTISLNNRFLGDIPFDVFSKRVDLAVSVLPLRHPNLKSTPFAAGRMVCALPKGHELASHAVLDLADIARYPLIAYGRGMPFGEMINAAFEESNLAYTIRCTIFQGHVACAMVQEGAGIAIVDEYSVAGNHWAEVEVRPLRKVIELAPSITHSAFEELTPIARRFVAKLKEIATSSTV